MKGRGGKGREGEEERAKKREEAKEETEMGLLRTEGGDEDSGYD